MIDGVSTHLKQLKDKLKKKKKVSKSGGDAEITLQLLIKHKRNQDKC